MKLKLLGIACLLAVVTTGCHSITMTTPSGPVTIKSFGTKTSIAEVQFGKNGLMVLKGYNQDQTTVLLNAIALGQSMAATAAKVP